MIIREMPEVISVNPIPAQGQLALVVGGGDQESMLLAIPISEWVRILPELQKHLSDLAAAK